MNPTRTYIGASFIAVAGILFWMMLMPTYDRITDLNSALAARNDILQNRSGIVANIATLAKQYSDHATAIQRFASIVPKAKSAAELVSSIQSMASQNGLTLTSIALTGVNVSDTNPYHTQTVDIGLTGTYPSLRSFLSAMESNIRIMDVITIDANPLSDNSSTLSFRLKANAYFLK